MEDEKITELLDEIFRSICEKHNVNQDFVFFCKEELEMKMNIYEYEVSEFGEFFLIPSEHFCIGKKEMEEMGKKIIRTFNYLNF